MYKRNFLHPERLMYRGGAHLEFLRTEWDKIVLDADVETVPGFSLAMQRYMTVVGEYQQQFTPETTDQVREMTPNQIEKSDAHAYITIHVEHVRVVLSTLFRRLGSPTYSVMCLDPRVQALQNYELEIFSRVLGEAITFEEMTTEWIMLHALTSFETYGKRVYEVSPGLQLLLENTKLKGLPTNQLRLPHPTIYLTLPPKYEVFNHATGMHPSEGVYVVEDDQRKPRTWRLILVGKHNEHSKHNEDDALYHWTVTLPEGKTIEDAIYDSTSIVEEVRDGGLAERDVEVQGQQIKVAAGSPLGAKEQVAHFDLMRDTLVTLFRYVMNVVLYATNPDAEITFSDANKDYERLRKRLEKLPKNKSKKKKKRRHIKQQIRDLNNPQQPRITLGRTIILNRAMKESILEGGMTKSKHRVRYLVSGHWHLYWKGKGRTIAEKKWIKPYFKGPEHAPLTQGKTRLK